MASRRIRIKGIPNVLTRKKPPENATKNNRNEGKDESTETVHHQLSFGAGRSDSALEDVKVEEEYRSVREAVTKVGSPEDTSPEDANYTAVEHNLKREMSDFENVSGDIKEEIEKSSIERKKNEDVLPDASLAMQTKETEVNIIKPPPRRKFINPKISASAVRRNVKQTEKREQEEKKSDNLSLKSGDINDIVTSRDTNEVTDEQKSGVTQKKIEIIENVEVELVEKIAGFVIPNANDQTDKNAFTKATELVQENDNLTERGNVSENNQTHVNVVAKEEPLKQSTILKKS